MPKLLKQLELEELSLVDRPANAKAMVSLFKRDNSNGDDMDYEVEKMDPKLKDKLKPYMDKGMSEEEAKKAYASKEVQCNLLGNSLMDCETIKPTGDKNDEYRIDIMGDVKDLIIGPQVHYEVISIFMERR